MKPLTSFMKFGGKVSFSISEETPSSEKNFLNRVGKILLEEGVKTLSRHGDIISFTPPFFRLRFAARFLNIIDNGFIRATIVGQHLIVTYRLSFLWAFWFAFFTSLVLPIFLLAIVKISFTSAISLFGLIFGLQFGDAVIRSLVSIFLFIKFTHATIYKANSIWKILYWFS